VNSTYKILNRIKLNSIQIYLCSAFHNTYCFKAALHKVHYRKVYGKIHSVNHVYTI